MKKNTYCLLIILVMLCACRSTDYYNITDRYEVISSTKEEEFVRFRPYVSEDSITMKFRVYEVDNELNILLDSVIKLTNEFYMEKTGRYVENNFSFLVQKMSRDSASIVIENVPVGSQQFNYGWHKNIFFYKGACFFCDGLYTNRLFKKTRKYFTFRCVDPRRFFANDLSTHPYCIWQYLYVNKRIQYVYSGKW